MFEFFDPGELRDGEMRLQLVATRHADPEKDWVPYYIFHILDVTTGERAGEIHLQIGDTLHVRSYGGHVAYGVRLAHRGRHFAARALRLLLPLRGGTGYVSCGSRATRIISPRGERANWPVPNLWRSSICRRTPTCTGKANGRSAGTGWI